MKKILFVVLLLSFSGFSYGDHGMNQATMEKIIKGMAVESKAQG